MWYRVFCCSLADVRPVELLASLSEKVEAHVKGDDLGWTAAELKLGAGTPIYVDRYLTNEDDLRDELNTWAGYLETLDYSPNHVRLMEHVIQTQQLVTIRKPVDHANESAVEELCQSLCQNIATSADGIYQIENDGWYAADGSLLLKEY